MSVSVCFCVYKWISSWLKEEKRTDLEEIRIKIFFSKFQRLLFRLFLLKYKTITLPTEHCFKYSKKNLETGAANLFFVLVKEIEKTNMEHLRNFHI